MTKNPLTMKVDGLEYGITFERRRYGKTTFTWVSVQPSQGTLFDLGDPWPVLNPKRTEIEAAIRNAETHRSNPAHQVRT